REYQSYWNYREQQADPSVYDGSFQVHLSAQELDYYQANDWTPSKIADLEAKRTAEYHDLHKSYGAMGNVRIADYSYKVVDGSDEHSKLTAGYYWTDEELSTSFNPSLLRTKTDTETKIEEANITAKNVFITTPNGGVGGISGSAHFDLPIVSKDLTDAQKIILAAAERDDMIATDVNGNIVNIFAEDSGAISLDVILHDDVDVAANGNITILSQTHVYLGSEQDINIDTIQAGNIISGGGAVRIKGAAGIFDDSIGGSANVTGGGVNAGIILEAAGHNTLQGIGTDTEPLIIDQLGGRLTARSSNNINLKAINHDLLVDTIYSSNGTVTITAEKSILNGNEDDQWNINASALTLLSGASIGASGNALNTELPLLDISKPSGYAVLGVTAADDVYINEVSGDMNVALITAGGDINLMAAVSILDANDNPDPDIIANSITLNTRLGGVGAAGNDLDIDSSATDPGLLNITSDQNIYLIETFGDLFLNQVIINTNDKKAYLAAQGSILDANALGEAAVIAGAAIFRSDKGVGTASKVLNSIVQNVEGSVTGNIWIHNNGALSVGGASDNPNGITTATGSIQITASSPVTIVSDVGAGADIIITSTDKAAAGDDLTIKNGVMVQSTAGRVILQSGDNIILESGSEVSAFGNVEMYGDFADADFGVGSIIDLQGSISGTTVQVYGNDDDDLVVVPGIAVETAIATAAGNDRIFVGSNADQVSNSNGLMSGINALLTVYGGSHSTGDALLLDDSGNTANRSGTINADSITGFGMGGSIHYEEIENLNISTGNGDNTFNVRGTAVGSTTTILADGGNDTFNISSDEPGVDGTLDNINGDLHLDGGDGTNTLNISDRGSSIGRTIVIDQDGVYGLGNPASPVDITYETSGSFGGGFTLGLGSGNDEVTVLGSQAGTITTVYLGGGSDSLLLHDRSAGSDGLVVGFGEDGSDRLDARAWNTGVALIGDNGQITSSSGKLMQLSSIPSATGGSDTILGSNHLDILMGGDGSDRITGGHGDDVILGDNGSIRLSGGRASQIVAYSTRTGGNDAIDGGSGDNILLGGDGSDRLTSGSGNDVILGDNGRVNLNGGRLAQIVAYSTGTNGNDNIQGGSGDNILMGGDGSDRITSGNGRDVLLGDNGIASFSGGRLSSVV
ncbi:MAG: calcium-binding protein, partial [Gammaproteobacteria bacterium]|nr:calcium-binding protein [Gammaproteobacteria bacterium]